MPRPKREIPWLAKRGEIFCVFWYDPNKRATEKLSLRTTDPLEAQERYAAFLTEGRPLFVKGAPGLTIAQALDHYYFEHIKINAVAVATVESNIHRLKLHFSNTPIKNIGVPECRDYIEKRLRQGAKPTTAGKELGTLKAAAYHEVKWKRLTLADMPTFELPSKPASKGVWLFDDELEALQQGAKALTGEGVALRTLSFIELCYYTASRREAIETLTWQQVDIDKRRIALAKHGEKKTNKRRPTIAVDPKLLPTLQRLKSQRTNMWVLGDDGRMDNWFHKAAKAGGVEYLPLRENRPASRITPHMLRHSRATHLLQAGKDIWAIANLLGDTIATVERVYGHHCALHTETLFDQPSAAGSIDEVLG